MRCFYLPVRKAERFILYNANARLGIYLGRHSSKSDPGASQMARLDQRLRGNDRRCSDCVGGRTIRCGYALSILSRNAACARCDVNNCEWVNRTPQQRSPRALNLADGAYWPYFICFVFVALAFNIVRPHYELRRAEHR